MTSRSRPLIEANNVECVLTDIDAGDSSGLLGKIVEVTESARAARRLKPDQAVGNALSAVSTCRALANACGFRRGHWSAAC